MNLSNWFHQQLQTSAEGVLWAVELIPPERLYLPPRPDKWPIARVLYHLVCYEQRLALPSMLQWMSGPQPVAGTPEEDALKEEHAWSNGQGYEVSALRTEFKALRARQLALLPQFTERDWQTERESVWGLRTLQWVVTKTYQHTLEHTDEMLRAYLWWK